jgi:hypothetical protein
MQGTGARADDSSGVGGPKPSLVDAPQLQESELHGRLE